MSDWLASIAGTPEGARLATFLALGSAIAHALFGALQKGRHDPWLSRGAIDVFLVALSLPMVLLVPLPTTTGWAILAGAVVIHFAYKLVMALAYERAAYTVVYPVVRGSGPLVTVVFASLLFSEHYTGPQWLGVLCLSGGILGLAVVNLRKVSLGRAALQAGMAWALAGGMLVAVYTVYDAWGIREAVTPFSFIVWFFLLTNLDFPLIAWWRWRRMAEPPALGPLALRGFLGAIIGYISFGGVMFATYLDKVGQAAVLRETSTVFAALVGWLLLGEKVGAIRASLMGVIALGAVIVEFGG